MLWNVLIVENKKSLTTFVKRVATMVTRRFIPIVEDVLMLMTTPHKRLRARFLCYVLSYVMKQQTKLIISIDCMGGDLGEQEVLKGIIKAYNENNSLFFIIHGAGKFTSHNYCENIKSLSGAYWSMWRLGNVVSMSDKPSQALRKGRNSSMWNALSSVSNGEAEVAISCGNTGALMAMSMMKLKKK